MSSTTATAVQTLQPAVTTRITRKRVITLSADGELGAPELILLGEELYRLSHRGNYSVVLDLTEVRHLDYRGVRPLVSRAELFRRAGGDIKLCGLSPYLMAIFRAAGARDSFETYATAEEARVAFARPGDR